MEWLIERLNALFPALARLADMKRSVADDALIAIAAALPNEEKGE